MMDFISLHDLINELLENVKRNESGEIMHKEYYYSEAAKLTRRHLRNKTHPIRWGESDGRFEPDFIDSDKNADEGMAILKHMEEWQKWKTDTRLELMEKLPNADKQWLDETIKGMEYKRGWPYKGADYLRAMKIGFDKKEISEFIERFKRQYSPKPEIKPDADQRPEPESVKGEKKRKDTFQKRLEALTEWLDGLDDALEGDPIILPKHYTLICVYTELGKKYPSLFANIEISSFDSHFWGRQKIVELMRGNKSTIL